MLFELQLDVSPSRPLTAAREQMRLTLLSVTLLSVTELFGGRKQRLLNQWSVMHLYGSKLGLCTRTNAVTPCSANVSPIQLNG